MIQRKTPHLCFIYLSEFRYFYFHPSNSQKRIRLLHSLHARQKKKSILCGWQMTWNTSRKVNWNPNRIIFDLQPCNSVMNKMEGLFIYVKMPKWNSCKKEENCWNWMCNPDEKRTQNMTMAYSKGFKRKITVRRRNQRKMRGIVTASNYL